MSQRIWFITGSSRGFGRALVHAALDAGGAPIIDPSHNLKNP